VLAEPTTALVLAAGSTYAVDHPSPDGDRCTVFVFEEEVVRGALGDDLPEHIRIGPQTQLVARASAQPSPLRDALDHEEMAMLLLRLLTEDTSDSVGTIRVGERQRKRVNDASALIASAPTQAWTLKQLADAVHVSPYYLAHQFREITGSTVGRYLLRIRLAVVLDRMTEGASSLSELAIEAGFSHHSHLTERFRSVFGVTPTVARATLTSAGRDELRSMLGRGPTSRAVVHRPN
jgi:AraC family transcriptional regulator